VAENNVVTIMTVGFILSLMLYLQRLLLRPNVLVADGKGVKLNLKCGPISVPLKKVAWSNIVRAGLHKPAQHAGRRSWKIRLTTKQAKNFDIDLSALAVDDRTLLLRRMEKLIPDCQIDYELSQSMVAKADRSYTELWLQSLSQAPERKTLEPLQPGQTVGENRFEVLKIIGVGGQGTAYLCRTLDDSSQTIVLKETIIPVFGENALRRRALEKFEHESKMLKSLDCEGIVKLLDYFIEDHRAYLVLEHIDGGSLSELVQREGALSHEQARDIALQMCEILKELHGKGIIHRDFTPDNLILNSKGKLKLIDFNVAQQVQSGSTGTIVGKHAYLPPEQFRGKATSQSDLYAFGATLFFLLTGQDPEPISQSSPQASNAAIDAGFDEIVKHATALQASARFESADQIAAALLSMDDHRLSTAVGRKVEVLERG
jgi:tRNA A-37 threonylcarbamoyl transferase component Bud32